MERNLKLSIILVFITLMMFIVNYQINNSLKLEDSIKTSEEILSDELKTEISKNPELTSENNIDVTDNTIVDIEKHSYYISSTIIENDEKFTQEYITYNNRFIPFYKRQIQHNYNKALTIKPQYIVIHETANTSIGADANAHYRYWNRDPNANASTHFVVDNKQIYQMLELNQSAWHVGDNKGYSNITNLNSIGIEVAVNADGDFAVARQNAIDLTINLMKALDMDISQLKRHHDASGKYCPTNMLQQPALWQDFVNQVQVGLNED